MAQLEAAASTIRDEPNHPNSVQPSPWFFCATEECDGPGF